ncbi:MAG: hypothetical protein N2A99_06385 [Carnobacterium alterfunditum]
MKKRLRKIALLVLVLIFLLPLEAFAALPSIARQDLDPDFKMTNGYQWNNSSSYPTLFYTVNHAGMYRTDYMYEMNWYVKVNGSRISKTLELMRPRNAGGDGRTFALPEDMSYWASTLNGDSSYLNSQASSAATIRNNYDGHSARRVYSRDLAKWSGSTLTNAGTGMYDGPPSSGNGHEMGEVIFTTTKKPTGSINSPASVTAGQSINVSFDGREYYPHSSYGTSPTIKYSLELDGNTISSGTKYSTTFNESHTLSSGICSTGTHNFKLTLTDLVGRTAVANKTINVTGSDCGYVPPPPPVTNDPPVPIFNWNPSTIYTDTNVSFTNNSYDPNGDPLTYWWFAVRPDGVGGSSYFSSDKYPNRIFDQEGTWLVELYVSDGEYTRTLKKSIQVLKRNESPSITLNYSPTTLYEGDTVTLRAVPSDPDGDLMTVIFEEQRNGTWYKTHEVSNVRTGQNVTQSFVVEPKSYQYRARVIDTSNATGMASTSFTAAPLEITGSVSHTPEWQRNHVEANRDLANYFSGEIFVTSSTVTNHPIESVTVTFDGSQVNGQNLRIQKVMTPSHPKYDMEIFDPVMARPETRLADGFVSFVFTAKWKNGVTKQTIERVNIVDQTYQAFDLHRTN